MGQPPTKKEKKGATEQLRFVKFGAGTVSPGSERVQREAMFSTNLTFENPGKEKPRGVSKLN